LIDAGSSKGVEKDMVVVYKHCLVGKVTEVYPWYSKVVAITDRTCKVAVQCVNQKTTGIHEGTNDLGATQLKYVSHLEPIEVGDYLISSGEGLVFPRGLGVGQIVSCAQSGLYHVIEVKPLIDMQKIAYCTVIKRGASMLSVDIVPTASHGFVGQGQPTSPV
jgi:rod shape-determining protein MreC